MARNWLQHISGLLKLAPMNSGAKGERLAEQHLRKAGLRFVARNWRNPKDRREEIDLVFRDREQLVFVEVKARQAQALVSGFHAVDRHKKGILSRAIRAYLGRLHPTPEYWRFDVVEVELGESPQVRHFANIPLR